MAVARRKVKKKSASRSILRIDPTRTLTLRRSFTASLRKRFNRLKGMVLRLVEDEDAFGLREKLLSASLATNQRWRFHSDPEKVRAFQDWLKSQVDIALRSQSESDLWRAYIERGFRKGAGRSFEDVKAKRPEIIGEGLPFYQGTREQFLRDSFARPVAREKVELLAGRSFDDLENVTADMSTRMTRTLADGLVQGKGPHEVARDLVKEVDIGRGRAETIARTELIRAHAEGQLTALDQLGVEEVGVSVEWSTAGDTPCSQLSPRERRNTPCVCQKCEPLEGIILTIEEARGMLPRHPN